MSEPLSLSRIKTKSLLGWTLAALVPALLIACGKDDPVIGGVAGTGVPPIGTGMNPVGATAGTTSAPTGAAGSTTTGTAGSTVTGAAGTGAGVAGRAAGAAGATTGTTAGSTGSAAGAPGGAAGSATGAAGAMATAGAGAAAGTGGGAAPAPTLGECMGGSEEPCGTFITNEGTKVPLGPYGAKMDANQGKGFEVAVAAGDADGGATCAIFASSFGEDPAATESLLDTKNLDFALYTVYRPATMKEGEKYPVISWGNGTCAQPEGYGALLRYTASHGFVVIAPNSRWVGGNGAMTKALDFAAKANTDMASPLFGRLDMEKVGAMGHSQGGGATVTAARDARIKNVIIWNGGESASKPFLAISGDRDIFGATANSMKSAVNGSPKGAFLFYHMIPGTGAASGHLTLMTQPERVVEPTVAWFKMMLNGDAEAKTSFVGADCKLCGKDAQFEFGQKGLE